jgi:GNAT superfamily N-acetyltransferase
MGIGTALMNHIEEYAKVTGSKRLHVPASYTALKFYEKRGYAISDEFKKGSSGFCVGDLMPRFVFF